MIGPLLIFIFSLDNLHTATLTAGVFSQRQTQSLMVEISMQPVTLSFLVYCYATPHTIVTAITIPLYRVVKCPTKDSQ